jgi:NAD(P)-dependent dehydrogenase (short-subunit alcohol dehydrogenase family)
MTERLGGKAALITGSTSGIGLAIAERFAAEGARLVLTGRNEAEGGKLAKRLNAHFIAGDVTERGLADRLVDATTTQFGRIDVLINNAGIILVGPVQAMTVDDFRRLMATNFWGSVYTTMAALPYMRARRFGRIANIMSLGGRAAAPHLAPYNTSKFALAGFTQSLRAELVRDNIHVTGVYPMTIRTGGHTHAWFKGDQRAEYTWFGLGDTIPGLSASADRSARAVLRAVCDGDPNLFVGLPARLAVALDNLVPGWTAEVLTLINQALPAPVNLDAPAVQGQELEGTMPDLLNRLVPASARP